MQLPPFAGLFIALTVLAAVIYYHVMCLKVINEPKTYPEYLLKLSVIADKRQFEFFQIAAESDNIPRYIVDKDWVTYIKTGKLPQYVVDFLEEGKDYINSKQILL